MQSSDTPCTIFEAIGNFSKAVVSMTWHFPQFLLNVWSDVIVPEGRKAALYRHFANDEPQAVAISRSPGQITS
jgi:hypothetical protein